MTTKNKGGRPRKNDQAMTQIMGFALTPDDKMLLDKIAQKNNNGDFSGTADFWRHQILSVARALEHSEAFVISPTGGFTITPLNVSTPTAEQR